MARKPRKWWATLGTMAMIVEAPLKAEAVEKARTAFERTDRRRRRARLDKPVVKLATPGQIARFEAAMEQVKRGR